MRCFYVLISVSSKTSRFILFIGTSSVDASSSKNKPRSLSNSQRRIVARHRPNNLYRVDDRAEQRRKRWQEDVEATARACATFYVRRYFQFSNVVRRTSRLSHRRVIHRTIRRDVVERGRTKALVKERRVCAPGDRIAS